MEGRKTKTNLKILYREFSGLFVKFEQKNSFSKKSI